MKTFRYVMLAALTCLFMISCSEEGLITEETISITQEITKSDDVISTASLPQSVLDYITSNYPNIMISKAEMENNGNYEVTLANAIELIFDSNGEFLGIDDDEGNDDYGDSHIDSADLPQAILDFIAANYPYESIEEAEIENNENFEVELSNDVTLVFDELGNFLGIGVDHSNSDDENEDEEDDYSNIDSVDLPQSVLDYIGANYPDETIVQAEIEDNGYFEVTLNNGMELYFDAEGNLINSEDENGYDEDEDEGDQDDEVEDDEDDDENHNTITLEEFSEYLVTCQYSVNEVEVNGIEIEDIDETKIIFASEGTLTATLYEIVYNGTWNLSNTDYGLKLSIVMIDGLSDISNEWILDEIDVYENGNDQIEFKADENKLELVKNCD